MNPIRRRFITSLVSQTRFLRNQASISFCGPKYSTIAKDNFNPSTVNNNNDAAVNVSADWKTRLSSTNKSLDKTPVGADAAKTLYDDWSEDYDTCLQQWGYNSPRMCVELLSKYMDNSGSKGVINGAGAHSNDSINSNNNNKFAIFDCGCGTGLVGQTLREMMSEGGNNNLDGGLGKLKFEDNVSVTGMDISDESIRILFDTKNDTYEDCKVWNMNEFPYPFENNSFDAIICAGVLTYCDYLDLVFNEWTRLLKSNGIIAVSNRSDRMKDDQIYFDHFVNSKQWKKLYQSDPEPYLPNNENYGHDVMVEYYIAQKL